MCVGGSKSLACRQHMLKVVEAIMRIVATNETLQLSEPYKEAQLYGIIAGESRYFTTLDACVRPPTSRDQLLSPPEAGTVLGLSPKTLANYCSKGNGPVFHRVGGRIKYRRSDLQHFIDIGRRSSTSDPGPDHE